MPCGKLVNLLRRHILKVKYISLVNLVIGRPIVEELVADRMNVNNLRHFLGRILPGGSDRQRMLDDYKEMNAILGGPGASERAGKEMVKLLSSEK